MRTEARLVRGHLVLASGSTQSKFSFNPTELPETAHTAGLAVHPVAEASSKDEFLGLSFDGVHGRVSVKHRRYWMITLAIEEALRRNALPGASLRGLVGHLSDMSSVTMSMSFDSFKRVRLY